VNQLLFMRALILITLLFTIVHTIRAQQFYADELLQMLSFPEAKLEVDIQKKGYLFSGVETKGDTSYKAFVVRKPYSKRKKEFTDRSIFISEVKTGPVIVYNTTKQDDFLKIKTTLEKKRYSVTKLFEGCPPLFFMFQNKEYLVTCQTFKQDTLTWYSFLFHKEKLPEKQTILFAEDLLQFDSHENLVAIFGAQNIKGDLYYFSEDEVNKCSVLFPNTPMQAVFIWQDEMHMKKLSSVIIGGRDEMQKPADPRKEMIVGENKWRFHNNIYIGMSLQQLRTVHGENFEVFAANSKYTGLVNSNKTGKVAFYRHHFVLGCLNCKESQEFRKRELMNADEAVRRGLLFFLLSVTLIPEATSAD
jgi:hypothetical protein